MLLELTGSSLTIDYRPQAQSFVTHRIGSTDKAERLLGFRATIAAARGPAVGASTGGWRSARAVRSA